MLGPAATVSTPTAPVFSLSVTASRTLILPDSNDTATPDPRNCEHTMSAHTVARLPKKHTFLATRSFFLSTTHSQLLCLLVFKPESQSWNTCF